MNIIEPCCAERQACFLLREERGHAVLMQTNGDVTIAKWLQAVMLLSGNRPRTLTLWLPAAAVPSVAVSQQPSQSSAAVPDASPADPPTIAAAILTTVSKYLRLGWVKKLRLMTPSPLTYNDIKHLAAHAECTVEDLLTHLELAADSTITNGLLQFDGADGTVIIQGAIPATVTPGLYLYAGIFGRTDGKAIRSITDATIARFRARRYSPSLSPSPAAAPAAFSASSGSTAATSPAPSSSSAPGSVPSGTAAGEVAPSSRKHNKKKENDRHAIIGRFLSPTHI